MTIPGEYAQEVRERSRSRLADIVSQTVTLNRQAGRHVGLCPFHDEKTGSFTLYRDGHYYCFGCRAYGGAVDFVMRHYRLPYEDAVKWVASFIGMSAPEGAPRVDSQRIAREAAEGRRRAEAKAQEERKARHSRAVGEIETILKTCDLSTHPYLQAKGFPDERWTVANTLFFTGPVGSAADQPKMQPYVSGYVVRGRDKVPVISTKGWLVLRAGLPDGRLAGGQYIAPNGAKLFHPGSIMREAFIRIVPRGGREVWLCEGYVTGLSVRAALALRKLRPEIRACLSAWNLHLVAKALKSNGMSIFVVADHDKSGAGVKAATDAGAPHWRSPVEGQDANDFHLANGLDRLATELARFRYPLRT